MGKAKTYYQYECLTGCGYETITDCLDMNRKIYCSNCAHDESLEFQRKVNVTSSISLAGLPKKVVTSDE